MTLWGPWVIILIQHSLPDQCYGHICLWTECQTYKATHWVAWNGQKKETMQVLVNRVKKKKKSQHLHRRRREHQLGPTHLPKTLKGKSKDRAECRYSSVAGNLPTKSEAQNSNPYTSMNKVKEFLKLSQRFSVKILNYLEPGGVLHICNSSIWAVKAVWSGV